MSKAYDFLKECGAFFVLTINGEYPAGRPFGAVMEIGDDLYLATNDMNEAHKQMRTMVCYLISTFSILTLNIRKCSASADS